MKRHAAVLFLAAAATAASAAADLGELDRKIEQFGGNRQARAQAREALAAEGARAVPALVGRIDDPRFSVRWEVVNLLGRIGDPLGVAPLVERVLEDEDAHVRWRAMWALRAIGDDSVADELAAHLWEEDPVRWRAAVGLSMFADPRGLALLTEGITSADPWIRWEAINALGRVHDGTTSAALLALLEHPDLRTRQEVVMTLGRIGDDAAAQGLIRSLDDPEAQVRWRAAMGLGRLGVPQARAALEDRLQRESDPQVRGYLLRALRNRAR